MGVVSALPMKNNLYELTGSGIWSRCRYFATYLKQCKGISSLVGSRWICSGNAGIGEALVTAKRPHVYFDPACSDGSCLCLNICNAGCCWMRVTAVKRPDIRCFFGILGMDGTLHTTSSSMNALTVKDS